MFQGSPGEFFHTAGNWYRRGQDGELINFLC